MVGAISDMLEHLATRTFILLLPVILNGQFPAGLDSAVVLSAVLRAQYSGFKPTA